MQYQVSQLVANYARSLGLCDEDTTAVALKISQMVRESAHITHPVGNRRYEEWLFKVENNEVLRVHLITCPVCEDRKRITVSDICEKCDGAGCPACRNRGDHEKMIPCPHCTGNQHLTN